MVMMIRKMRSRADLARHSWTDHQRPPGLLFFSRTSANVDSQKYLMLVQAASTIHAEFCYLAPSLTATVHNPRPHNWLPSRP